MSLRALRSLVAISRHGSFARAAETLGLTPSAVSLHVKLLEAEFGVALFDRSRRSVRLTEAGREALARAEDILAAWDGIAEALSRGPDLVGQLRLGAVQTALAGPLPDALARLRREHPRLRISVASGMSAELARRIDDGDLDAAITTEPVPPWPRGLRFTPAYGHGFWVVAAPALAGRDPRSLLTTEPFLRFDKRAWAGRLIDAELRRQGIAVTDLMEIDSQEALLHMAANGLGVAIVPMDEADFERSPPLTRMPFGTPQLTRRMGLLEREDSGRARFSAALVETLRH
ncbi:LysR family transcriptional regulator (plasmid) [Paroceanicella profunda]|uniref:LysR family transcriptional regulator n=1 Tax=Paroceanicella profunda TaxID=2579971 RepID=A0A5B8G5L1_9RHOB|nr:LysR family transcriptional regulator [Paroceanicella profunda]QDL94632.1 LysR family transcriptional regulator [Paroceanicella profunda]